jgi:hypothetical protein
MVVAAAAAVAVVVGFLDDDVCFLGLFTAADAC